MKRQLLIGITAAMFFVFGVGSFAIAKADLSGVWTLDAGKSEGLPAGIMQTMTVAQKGDLIEIETRTKVGESQERVGKDAFVLDGKEADFSMPLPPGAAAKKAKRTSKWTDDGNGFDVAEVSVVNAPDGSGEATIRAKRRWRLSADGKTLTIEMEAENPRGTSKSKRVFVKK